MDGKIVSAYALDEAAVRTITEKFTIRMGTPVVLQQEVDPSIVAGFIVTIGYHRFDFSAKARLKEMMRHMLNN